jgi:ESCRT-I complex subunit VPS28
MRYETFSNLSISSNSNEQEVKLAETRAERDLQDSLAEVFSIIITLDELEKAYLKDAISEAEYTEICDRLLKQYKAILTDEAVSREFVDLETFKNEWDVWHALFTSIRSCT